MPGSDDWLAALEPAARDLAAPFRAMAGEHRIAALREVSRRARAWFLGADVDDLMHFEQLAAPDAALAAGSAGRGSRGVGR